MPGTKPQQTLGGPAFKPGLKNLYYIGSLAAFLTLVFYISEFVFIRWDDFPTSPEAWFQLFQRSKLLGLFYLNSLDILSITLLGVMFLALFMALKQVNKASMLIAAYFYFLGVAAFVVPRIAMLSLLSLSDQFAAATTEAERVRLLAAGETLGSLGTATPQTAGFFFMAVGVTILSIVMLQGQAFSKVTAVIGIVASLLTFADDISIVLVPTMSTPLMVASGLFWILWWIMIGIGLLRLAGKRSGEGMDAKDKSSLDSG